MRMFCMKIFGCRSSCWRSYCSLIRSHLILLCSIRGLWSTAEERDRTKGKLTPGCSSHHASTMIASICVRKNHDQLLFCFSLQAVCLAFHWTVMGIINFWRTCVAKDVRCVSIVFILPQEWLDTAGGSDASLNKRRERTDIKKSGKAFPNLFAPALLMLLACYINVWREHVKQLKTVSVVTVMLGQL